MRTAAPGLVSKQQDSVVGVGFMGKGEEPYLKVQLRVLNPLPLGGRGEKTRQSQGGQGSHGHTLHLTDWSMIPKNMLASAF